MDLLAPCRSCLRCLPFFQISPPSSPRASATASTSPAAAGQVEEALPLPDPNNRTHSLSADAPLHDGHDLPFSDKKKEPHPPLHSSLADGSDLQNSVIPEDEGKPASEIIFAPPVSSPPSRHACASPHELVEVEETNKSPTHPELPLNVPFINDISFLTSGLPSPITPAPFGTGYGYPAGQYHPAPHNNPPGNDKSDHNDVPSHEDHGNLHVAEHVNSHAPLHYWHSHSQQGHDDSHHGHISSHHNHGHAPPPDESLPLAPSEVADSESVDIADVTDTYSPPLDTSYSTPGFLDTEGNQEGGKSGDADATPNMGGKSALIETYHSEPIVTPEDDDSYTNEESFGHNALDLGRRRRRRDHFKDQFKGISQQIKHGGHHIKKEGSKHLQTIISNVNKQAQQIDQSGSFLIVPRANNN
ncbi:hypothetical protein L7F22_041349 [Adiantum nelumboides]|nr:hypothetical protein [Adiantum nelumboides]